MAEGLTVPRKEMKRGEVDADADVVPLNEPDDLVATRGILEL